MNWYKKANNKGILDGLVEEGLNSEHKNIGEALDKYIMDNDKNGIFEAINDPDYGAYYNNLQLLLKASFGDVIEVRRKEGYSGGTGEGVGEYVSVSWFPTWHGERYWINRADVVLAGHEGEGELIVKRNGLRNELV